MVKERSRCRECGEVIWPYAVSRDDEEMDASWTESRCACWPEDPTWPWSIKAQDRKETEEAERICKKLES